jgi:protein-S-isoprenylcysteine O-methyltransferase Ste14
VRVLAIVAVVPAVATFYFAVFWRWFEFWRRHLVATYAVLLGAFAASGILAWVFRDALLAPRIALPGWIGVLGWILIGLALVLGTVADRQIGFRVRSFAPFFTPGERIELVTTGAYGIVRHPIYAAGIYFQLGVFLATGAVAVAVAGAVFAGGAAWFTRQEERRLVALLADPTEYDRYRARVPALVPWPTRSRAPRSR